MSTLQKVTLVEGKLFLREPMSVIFGVFFPTALLLGLGAIPALREPSEEFDGARFVEVWAPTALVLGIGILGLQHIPNVVSSYRENRILRRISTTPVHPATLLVAQLIVALAAAVAAAVLLIVAAWLVLDVPLPQEPLWFTVAFLVGFAAVLAIGMLIAAVAPNTRLANGLAMVAYMVAMFAGGVFLPRFLLPDALVRIGDYTPPGVQALLDAWSGDEAVASAVGVSSAGPPELLQLGIMALIAVVAGWAAARLFRWE
ncbi:ABC transporter permease [Phytoactinopolyspora halotolerans]|uniref:ABC transporter permease n=2 Tax=Phytoactinopolyspora halotolerans TaxID=1981512 RepID=A0A6L9S3L8_9ACTN|nr:ABC transporter permease [Phytoactinopolyspora halotolerans]